MSVSQGCDVSYAQGAHLDYAQLVKAGVQFAWCKCLDWSPRGGYFADETHDGNIAGFRAAGAIAGSYCFFHTTPDPIEFADRFAERADLLHWPAVLDVETLSGGKIPSDVGAKALVFLQRFKEQTGTVPVLYASTSYLLELGRQAPGLAKFPIWIAEYHVPPSPDRIPRVPAPFMQEKLIAWQWTGEGRLPGCQTLIDRDVLQWDVDDVMALAVRGAQSPCPSGPTLPVAV